MKNRKLELASAESRSASSDRYLTASEEAALFAAHARGDERARETIIRGVMHMAGAMAEKWCRSRRRIRADMEQAAYVGLLVAFDRFDPARGTRFSTYAMEWVRHELNDLAARQRQVGPGRVTQREWAAIVAELGSGLSEAEVAAKMRVRLETVRSAVAAESYEEAGGEYTEREAGGYGPHELLEWRQSVERVDRWLAKLTDRERDVVSRCVLADDREDRASVARGYGLSRERIRHVEIEALAKLKRRVSREMEAV